MHDRDASVRELQQMLRTLQLSADFRKKQHELFAHYTSADEVVWAVQKVHALEDALEALEKV